LGFSFFRLPSSGFNVLRLIAAISGIYDAAVGLFLLVAADRLAGLFGVPPAHPRVFSDLNAIFLLAVAAGYYFPWRDPRGARWYLWVMGPGLKGAGALAFVIDYGVRHSPASFLLFAFSDGSLALVTLWALVASRSTRESPRR
jgi:hypothetical protein